MGGHCHATANVSTKTPSTFQVLLAQTHVCVCACVRKRERERPRTREVFGKVESGFGMSQWDHAYKMEIERDGGTEWKDSPWETWETHLSSCSFEGCHVRPKEYTAMSKKMSRVLWGPSKSRVVFCLCCARAISRTLADVILEKPCTLCNQKIRPFLCFA